MKHNNIIPCPHCGSTAQPQIVDEEYIRKDNGLIGMITYQCSCRRLFLVKEFYTLSYNILKDANI